MLTAICSAADGSAHATAGDGGAGAHGTKRVIRVISGDWHLKR